MSYVYMQLQYANTLSHVFIDWVSTYVNCVCVSVCKHARARACFILYYMHVYRCMCRRTNDGPYKNTADDELKDKIRHQDFLTPLFKSNVGVRAFLGARSCYLAPRRESACHLLQWYLDCYKSRRYHGITGDKRGSVITIHSSSGRR